MTLFQPLANECGRTTIFRLPLIQSLAAGLALALAPPIAPALAQAGDASKAACADPSDAMEASVDQGLMIDKALVLFGREWPLRPGLRLPRRKARS
ncbi:hypothetical protein [Erythrobacter tepidarius]|uniref:hypothetical protein n=1 Tax=Erythrobacter tepidarius TaxID=60454 RepID=UPI000A38456E|nr:hypothetical protein [Erythrobacter tepidarius]